MPTSWIHRPKDAQPAAFDADNDHALIFTLESVKANAPWIRRIYVLQNPQCEQVWKAKLKRGVVPQPDKTLGSIWLKMCSMVQLVPQNQTQSDTPEPLDVQTSSRTHWIDRCSLFPHPSREKEMALRFRQERAVLQQLDETFPELGIYHQGPRSLLQQLGVVTSVLGLGVIFDQDR